MIQWSYTIQKQIFLIKYYAKIVNVITNNSVIVVKTGLLIKMFLFAIPKEDV